ncbi:hypothetical protein MFMK1_003603 [Metallumcola ferriviriculae]|uniref:Uncharacterized protein n=1 Tax=Metallumcola ferriviriculae TaxID=3039180 RepID=A0AAU0USX3_9FIRM|nr:hypothetical protein MFMK1_003603 [Desulfitibacteraceae bacterium MK1]
METRNYSNFNQAVKKGVLIFGSLSFLFNLYAIVVLNKSAAPMDLVHILPGFVVNAIWEGAISPHTPGAVFLVTTVITDAFIGAVFASIMWLVGVKQERLAAFLVPLFLILWFIVIPILPFRC